ncbi:MAG: hypothetical protein P8166_12560, partial [Candidatus Thiodiazotropha sp.]
YQAYEIFDALTRQLGVKYLYEEKSDEIAVESPARLSSQMLLKLPPELWRELQKSALQLDYQRAIKVVEQIQEINPGTAAALRQLTESFAFDQVLRLLEEADLKD